MLGVSQPTLSAWEGERKNPSVESLIQMSELYGVSVDFLLGLPEARYHGQICFSRFRRKLCRLFMIRPSSQADMAGQW